jgi:transcriptional regulator with XRE-family HTH domain
LITDSKLGFKLKKKRLEKGLSLRELGRRTELTASFLSQVERGKTNVSLESLRRIADKLSVPLLYFLSEKIPDAILPSGSRLHQAISKAAARSQEQRAERESSGQYSPVVRSGDRSRLTLPNSGMSYDILTPFLGQKFEAVCGRLAPGSSSEARKLRVRTEEFIYVLEGELTVTLSYGDYTLAPGDTIYYRGKNLRRITCTSVEREAVWIYIITPPAF